MKHSFVVQHKNVLLRPIKKDDLESLRNWRNDVQSVKYLAKLDYITPEMQLKWYKKDLADTGCYTFAIEELEISEVVGSISLYNFRGKTAEMGRALIGSSARGKGIGFLATALCLYLGFYRLGFESITASVHEDNIAAKKAYEKCGFQIVGKHKYADGGEELEISIEKDYFFEFHTFLSDIQFSEM